MMGQQGDPNRPRTGRWLPDQDSLEDWLEGLTRDVDARPGGAFRHPVMREFRDLIDRDPVVRLELTEMIAQVPHDQKRYRRRHVRDLDHLLALIDAVIGRAPEYSESGLVGVPLNAVLDWCMGTPAGFAAFRHEPVNGMLRKILATWCEFLSGPESLAVLNDSPRGWKCASARKSTMIDQFQVDEADPHWGFQSWNDYFTRRFKPELRPVADPDDPKVIVSACESTPYAIRTDVQRVDEFWIKAQPYSLVDLLAHDPSVDAFVGGTVYQAFLDAHSYHRWHSPVGGTIRRAFLVPGTYFSEAEAEGEDPEGPVKSQGYLAHVAARAIILIEADDPTIGLMAVVPIGMVEVSSCVIGPDIKEGSRVAKGDELGHFQFGGSTHCLIFRPGTIEGFDLQAMPAPAHAEAPLVLVRSRIARAR